MHFNAIENNVASKQQDPMPHVDAMYGSFR